jgi:hypothetical protein
MKLPTPEIPNTLSSRLHKVNQWPEYRKAIWLNIVPPTIMAVMAPAGVLSTPEQRADYRHKQPDTIKA